MLALLLALALPAACAAQAAQGRHEGTAMSTTPAGPAAPASPTAPAAPTLRAPTAQTSGAGLAAATTEPRAALAARLAAAGSGSAAVAVLIDAQGRAALHLVGQATPRTRFELGSITKAMTGSLLARVAARGQLDLDAPIERWWPDLAGRPAGALTLSRLATHTAGLPRLPKDWATLRSALRRPQDPYAGYTAADLQAWLQGWEGPEPSAGAGEPGAGFAYSNAGFAVIGQVLERALGQPYEALLQREILAPAGLQRAALGTEAITGHDTQGWPTAAWQLGPYAAAGALRADAEDVATLLQALRQGLPPFDAGAQQARATRGEGLGVGLGWLRTERHGARIVWHNGGTGGHRAFLGVDEVTGRAVALMANGHVPLDDLGLHLLDARFPLAAPEPPARGVQAWLALLLPLWGLAGLARRAWRPTHGTSRAEIALHSLSALAVLAVLARLGDFRPWQLGDVGLLPLYGLLTLTLWAAAVWRHRDAAGGPSPSQPIAGSPRWRTVWATFNASVALLLAAWAWGA